MAGHASVALENARLYEAQRREAESAKALLALSRDLAEAERHRRRRGARRDGRGRHPREPEHVGLAAGHRATESLRPPRRLPGGGPDGAPRSRGSPSSTSGRGSTRREPFTVEPSDYADHRARCPRARTDASRSPRSSSTAAGASSRRRSPPSRPARTASSSSSASIARQTRLALQTAASYESLERTFLSTVEALANALEANDEYTSTHARWITDLALRGR